MRWLREWDWLEGGGVGRLGGLLVGMVAGGGFGERWSAKVVWGDSWYWLWGPGASNMYRL